MENHIHTGQVLKYKQDGVIPRNELIRFVPLQIENRYIKLKILLLRTGENKII
jgi:hypothetical protein